ncbi:BRO-N domain-containing protein [Aliiroseovarius crassostreae]|uniref:BRO-N domain-containing protein n=1 Tax=Aliiroseovarius crassostreae TaxID=154981 RepID=UPI00220175E5|nr:BRO family protein [Aliiroseovarius crassostreae]UWP99466.1 hypothetical protein K3X53_04795 [Aliiroseovarius crassostreae]
MTDQLKTFEAPQLGDLKFTVWDREGEPWFIAKEVFKVLQMKTRSTKTSLLPLGDTEKEQTSLRCLGVLEGPLFELHKYSAHRDQWFISESGLYKLIMRSNKPEAQQFQDWVTKVVLPAIRKDGANPPPNIYRGPIQVALKADQHGSPLNPPPNTCRGTLKVTGTVHLIPHNPQPTNP